MKQINRDRIIYCSILLVALVFRFTDLSLKPPHSDEGGNGFFVNQIWSNGFFTYDPGNYHGPLLFYLFQISEKIFGFGVHSFRIVTAFFSFLTVWLVLYYRNVIGRYASFFIAVALAISPGMIFFGRSAIHEAVFVFSQFLWIMGFLKLRESAEKQGFIMFSAGLLGSILLKETFLVFGVAFVVAWVWAEIFPKIAGWLKIKKEQLPLPDFSSVDEKLITRTIVVAAIIWIILYTGFFHNRKGISDFFMALMPWLKTGVSGSGHDKPFFYWLQLMLRYEWFALAGLAAALAGVFKSSWKMRFFSVLALMNWLIYSIIPYKTPWCIISIIWPLVVVAGLWADVLILKLRAPNLPAYLLAASAVVVVFGHSVMTGYRLNFVNYSDPSERYVYVQTKNDIKRIEDILMEKIHASPAFQNMHIQINLNDSWPLPWLFSRFPNTQFNESNNVPVQNADVIFTELSAYNGNLAGLYWQRKIDLRDAREPIYVYLKASTFEGMSMTGFSVVGLSEKGEF